MLALAGTRIKTQCLLPCAETASMVFWGLLASGQITLRKVDGWRSLARKPRSRLTVLPNLPNMKTLETRLGQFQPTF